MKLVNHQRKFHPNVDFWVCSEKDYKIMDTKVSVLFFCQKMLAQASLDTPFDNLVIKSIEDDTNFSFFKAKMAFVFGVACGNLSFYSRAFKNFGASQNEKDDFLQEVKNLLELLMVQALSFNWREFLLLEENSYS
jgi:hypothetical protein